MLKMAFEANYTNKAKKLTDEEKSAVDRFIVKVHLNLEDKLRYVILFGSSAYVKKHDDVDLAVIIDHSDIAGRDPFTNEKSYERATCDSYGAPLGEELGPAYCATVIENKVDIDGTDIHYLILPKKFGSPINVSTKRNGRLRPISETFIGAILEDGIVLYEREDLSGQKHL